MKKKFLKIGLPIFLSISTISTLSIAISSCVQTPKYGNVSPTPTRSINYQEVFPKLTTKAFINSFESKSGIDSILKKINYDPKIYKYVDNSLKINNYKATFWLSNNKNIYEITLFNFFDNDSDPNKKFSISKNKIIPKNVINNESSKIINFKFNSMPEQLNLYNLKTTNNKNILVNKESALSNSKIVDKIKDYKSNLLNNLIQDIDGGIKFMMSNVFNNMQTLLSPSRLFYSKNINLNPKSNKLEGTIYLQIKNDTNKNVSFVLFNNNFEIPSSNYLTISIEFNSEIMPNISKIDKNNFLGLNLNNVNIKTEIGDENVNTINDAFFQIERSNILNTEITDVYVGKNLFNENSFLSNSISNLNLDFFNQSLKENAIKEFNDLKNSIIGGIEILEVFNNIDVTLEDVLKNIGTSVGKILKMAKVDNNIIEIAINLLNPQTTSDFLYKVFPNIINILDQNGANNPATTSYFIKNFLIENLGNKSKNEFEYFISNLKNLKETVKKFIMGMGMEPNVVSSILALVDKLSENNNIFTFLSNNFDSIAIILKNLLPKDATSQIILTILNSIQKIEINNQTTNIFKAKFWNLVTNTDTNAKVILIDLLVTISELISKSSNQNSNLISQILLWIKNFLDNASIIYNFNPTNLVAVLDTLLNPQNSESTKQYFNDNFIIEFPEQQSLNYDNLEQTLNGEFQYNFRFTKELRWDMTKFKQVFYDDGLKLFSLYANWWFDQTKPETNSDASFIFVINNLSKVIGTALTPNRKDIEGIPNGWLVPNDVKILRQVLLGFIDANNSNLTEEELTKKNKENFNLLFKINLTNVTNSWYWGIIKPILGAILPIDLPIEDLAGLSMTIDNQSNINKTYERYWKVFFGDNAINNPSYFIPANSYFSTKHIYNNSQVYPQVDENSNIIWSSPYNWVRDMQGLDGIFKQSALTRIIFSIINKSKQINFISKNLINSKISEQKLENYSNNVANLKYKLVLDVKNIELTNKLFETLKSTYKNSQITPEIQQILDQIFHTFVPNNDKLFKPTFFIIPDNEKNPTKYNIQLFFPTNILIVDKEDENLFNKTVQFSNLFQYDLTMKTQ